MRVLLTGANGLIGSAVSARLRREGHEVVAVTRTSGWPRIPGCEVVILDIGKAVRAADWRPHLKGCHAVVNCAGLLQDAPGRSTRAVHVDGTGALFEACEFEGVRRVVHVSALGADRDQPTEFSRTKHEGDLALMARDLDWVILRPSVVVGGAAYGGSALFRGLAALPILPVVLGPGPLQIVQLDDVASTVAFFVRPGAPAKLAIDLAGPERLSFTDVVLAYRGWLGWAPPITVPVPGWAANVLFRAGDALGWLGWRPPIRSTAQAELARGSAGDNSEWRRITGIEPQSLSAALASEPASVQERWFARLYFLKPLAFGVFSAFWITTGLIALGPGWEGGKALIAEAGASNAVAAAMAGGGALLDIAIGMAVAFRQTTRVALLASLVTSVVYAALGTFLVPRLWWDPLGPIAKIAPILVLNLVLLAIHRDR